MSKPYADREVWFLTGSQGLYGEETLRQVAEQSQEVARTLDASDDVPATIVWKPVLTDSAAIRRAMLDANSRDDVLGVITWMHTFSPAKMWIAGLDELRKPLLHLHTQLNRELPWASIDMDFMNLNQAAHGDREFGFLQTRLGLARKTVAGHVTDPEVVAALIDGNPCDQFAFRQEGVDWQVWIQKGDSPLPRKLVITTTDEVAQPQYISVLDWNLAPALNDAMFIFAPPPDSYRIAIQEITAEPAPGK